jgi:heat shock protein HslJ
MDAMQRLGPGIMRRFLAALVGTLLIFIFTGAVHAQPGPGARVKAENDWTRLMSDLLPAIQACLEQPAVPVESILKAWPMNHGLVGVRLRSAGGHRFECLAPASGTSVMRLIGLMPEEEKVPGEGEPVFLPKREHPPAVRVDELEQVVDGSGAVLGWIYYAGGAPTLGPGERIYATWRLDDIAGRGTVDRLNPPLSILRDGTLRGESGCNRFTGKATIDGEKLKIGNLATTRRACPPAVMDQEKRFLAAMRQAAGWRIENEMLVLTDDKGGALLRFSRDSR